MMRASRSTSRRTLSCTIRHESAAARPSPPMNARSITRLNLAFRPMHAAPGRPRSLPACQFGCLCGRESTGHRGAQFVLVAADRGSRVGAEYAVHLAIVVAEMCKRRLHAATIGLGHLLVGRERRRG